MSDDAPAKLMAHLEDLNKSVLSVGAILIVGLDGRLKAFPVDRLERYPVLLRRVQADAKNLSAYLRIAAAP